MISLEIFIRVYLSWGSNSFAKCVVCSLPRRLLHLCVHILYISPAMILKSEKEYMPMTFKKHNTHMPLHHQV